MLNYSNMMMQLKTATPEESLKSVIELKDKLEIVLSAEASFLPKALPHLCELMSKYTPQAVDSDSCKIRHVILELLGRLPHSDAFRPHATSVMALAMRALAEDNDDNAVLAVKIIFELHKSFRPILEPHVGDFLLLVVKLYANMKGAVDKAFGGTSMSGEAMAVDEPVLKAAGMESFRVLSECPLAVMLLFQFYPSYLSKTLPQLIPLMVGTLLMAPPSPGPTSAAGKSLAKELLLAQVKTLSFVTYLLRSHAELLRQYEADIAATILGLLAACPPDATASRKEILVAARHIIATDFRNGLYLYIDNMLDEDLLLGVGRPASLRPLAYTMLSDFTHHAKEVLNLSQITRVVGLFNVVLHDATLPSSIHVVAIKLLVKLVEILGQNREQQDVPMSNTVLFKVFKSLVGKLSSLRLGLDKAAEVAARVGQESSFLAEGATATWFKSMQDPASANCISVSTASRGSLAASYFRFDYPVADVSFRDIKMLLKATLSGIKPLVSQIENMKISNENSQVDKTSRLKKFIYLDKMKFLGLYFHWALESCTVFPLSRRQGDGKDSSSSLSQYDATEVKEMMELFTGSLASLHTDTLRLLLRSKIAFLVDMTLNSSIFLVLFQQIFSSAAISAHLMDITLSYFLSNVFSTPSTASVPSAPSSSSGQRSRSDQKSTILLRIFKFMLSSISVYPENEKILITRLPKLITSLLRFVMVSKSIIHECNLLRLVFRTISGGKMEMSINAISPIYGLVLDALDRLLTRRRGKVVTNIILDLSLTVPARVSTQLAHLPLLLKFASLGLHDQNDVASVALKSLELWLDHSTPTKFVAAIESSVGDGLVTAIMRHLKPPPYHLGLFAFRVLGKMGGHSLRELRTLLPAADAGDEDLSAGERFLSLHAKMDLGKEEGGEAAVSVDLTRLLLGACELLEHSGEGDPEQSGDATQAAEQPLQLPVPPLPPGLRALYAGEDSSPLKAAAGGAAKDALAEWASSERLDTPAAELGEQKRAEEEAAYISVRLLSEQKQDAFELLLATFAATTPMAILAESTAGGCSVSLPKASRGGAPVSADMEALQRNSKVLAVSARMVTAVLWAMGDIALGNRASELLAGLCYHYAFLLYRPGADLTALLDSHSFTIVNDVIVSSYCHCHSTLNQKGAVLVAMWVGTLRSTRTTLGMAEPLSTATCPALRALVADSCRLLTSYNFNEALSGARLLSDLCALFADCPMWCRSQLQLVLLSLLEALQQQSFKATLFAAAEVLACVRAVLSSCLREGEEVRGRRLPEESLQLALCRLCCDPCPHVRRAAKVVMGLLAEYAALPIDQAFGSARAAVLSQLRLACEAPLDEGTAYGLVYFIHLGFVSVESPVVDYLSRALAAAEAVVAMPADPLFGLRSHFGCADPPHDCDGEGIVLAASAYPTPVPPEVVTCLAAAHLLHAVVSATAQPDLLEELFPRLSAFLFKVLCSNEWGEAVDAAGATLDALSNNPCLQPLRERYFTKKAVEESLQPAFVAIQDIKLLSRQLLKSFQVVLRAFPDYFSYDNFASRLVEYLQVLSEPEKNVTMNVFVSGEEHLVATHLVTLFSLVPSVQAIMAYFEDLVLITVDLDQNCHRYWYSNNLSTTDMYAPLVDIISKYPAETMAYFFDVANLSKPKILYFLLKLLKLAAPLVDKFLAAFRQAGAAAALERNVIQNGFDGVSSSFTTDAIGASETLIDAAFHGVTFVRRLTKAAPRLLLEEPGLASTLSRVWRRAMASIPARPAADPHPLLVINQTDRLFNETKSVCKCIMSYCRACPDDHEELFSLVDFLIKSTPVDLTFLLDFLRVEVQRSLSHAQKRSLLEAFVRAYSSPSVSVDWKVRALQALVLPTLVGVSQNADALAAVVDAGLVRLFVNDVLVSMDGEGGGAAAPTDSTESSSSSSSADASGAAPHSQSSGAGSPDALKVELLKVSSLLLEHASPLMRPYKKDLIRAPWGCIKSEDLQLKYWAYVCICRFIAAFESPAKIIIQVFVALLRSSPHEGKEVVRLALDVLVPALPVRLSPEDLAKCIKWTKKLVFDEALNNTALLSHIWSVVVRHCKTFYPFRAQLVPQMISTISRIGLPPSTSMEYRQVALSIADVVVGWEWARRHGIAEGALPAPPATTHKRPLPATASATSAPLKRFRMAFGARAAIEAAQPEQLEPPEPTKGDYLLPPALLSVLANFVVRLGFFIVESKDASVYRYYPRCLALYKALVRLFPFRDMKLSYFDKMIQTMCDSSRAARGRPVRSGAPKASGVSESLLLTLLEHLLVGAEVSDAPQHFFSYVLLMQDLVDPIIESDNPAVLTTFRALLVSTAPLGPPGFAQQGVFHRLGRALERGLQAAAAEQTATDRRATPERRSLLQSLLLLKDLSSLDARWTVMHGSALTHTCQLLLSEHLVRAVRATRSDPLQSQADADLNMFTAAAHPSPWVASLARRSSREPVKTDEAPLALLLAMQCLLIGVGAGVLPQHCTAAVALLSSVLESSDSPSLLGLAVGRCAEWVVGEASPLSARSRWQLFKQLCKAWGRLSEHSLSPFSLVITKVALDVSELLLRSGDDAFSRRFGSKAAQAVGRGVLPLATMSPVPALRARGLAMLASAWGLSAADKLAGLLCSELLYLSNRYFPSMLSQLLLQACDARSAHLLAGAAARPALAAKKADLIVLEAAHPYAILRARLASSAPVAPLEMIDRVALSHAAGSDTVWRQLLSRFWDALSTARRAVMATSIERFVLVSKPASTLLWPAVPGAPAGAVHSSVQGLLRALGSMEHPPLFSPEFLGAVGHTFSVWHEAQHFLQLRLEEEGGDEGVRRRALLAAVRLHEQLEDGDSALALLRLHGDSSPGTVLALSLESHGRAADAQNALLAAMRQTAAGLEDSAAAALGDAETWQRRWVANAKELSSWAQLAEVGKRLQASDLRMEAAVMLHSWEEARSLRSSASVAGRGHWTNLGSKTREIMLAIADRRSGDCDRLCAQAIQVALMRWQQLPPLAAGSSAHRSILHSFHRIVELRESSSTMAELSRLSSDKSLPESKNPQVWKSRLPDRSESLQAWSAVLRWRLFMYDSMRRAQPSVELEEAAQCALLLAKTARHHALPEAAARALPPAAGGSKDAVFRRMREQVLLSLSAGTWSGVGDAQGALRHLGLLPLSGLDSSQAAEVQRLRGLCLQSQGPGSAAEAQEAYSRSVQMDGSSAKAWLSWGHFSHEQQRSGSTAAAAAPALDSAACVLKAVELGSQPARMLLGRAIQAFSIHTSSPSSAAADSARSMIEAHSAKAAALWAWLPYLPALLNSLLHRGNSVFKSVLLRLAAAYPQALVFHLLSDGYAQREGPYAAAAEELLAAARTAAPQLQGAAAQLCDLTRPPPSALVAAELSAVLALLVSDLALRPADPLPAPMARRIEASAAAAAVHASRAEDRLLAQVVDECAALSRAEARPKAAAKTVSAGEAAAALREMLRRLADERAAPLLAAGPSPARGRGLDSWTTTAAADASPSSLQLRGLLELPGQYDYCSFRAPNIERHLRIVAALPVQTPSQLRLLLSDGTVHCFAVERTRGEAYNDAQSLATRLVLVVDWALLEHHRSRRLDLSLRCPRAVPLAATLLLRESADTERSLQSLLEAYSRSRGEMEDPLLMQRARATVEAALQRAGKGRAEDAGAAAALEAYSQCASEAPSSLLSHHLLRLCQVGPVSAQSRRAFAAQLGAHSLLQMLLSHPALADELTVSSGGLIRCSYRHHGAEASSIADGSPPFRLTRNMAACVSPALMLGSTGVAMGAAADALLSNADTVESALELFLAGSAQALVASPAASPAVQAALELLLRVAPASQRLGAAEEGVAEPVDAQLLALLEQARDERRNAAMPFSYLPWM